MKTCPVEAELLHADGRTAWRNYQSPIAILRTRLKTAKFHVFAFLHDMPRTACLLYHQLVRRYVKDQLGKAPKETVVTLFWGSVKAFGWSDRGKNHNIFGACCEPC